MAKVTRRKLLILTTDLEIGGTPEVVKQLALGLRGEGVELCVACLAPMGPIGDELRQGGVEVHGLGGRSVCDVAVLGRLVQLIDEHRIGTVLSLLMHANVAATAAKLIRPELRVFQSIQTTQPNPRWHWVVQGLIAGAAERFIVPSASVMEFATKASGISQGRFSLIPNGVDTSRFAFRPRRAGALFTVGFAGRLDPIKRIDHLIAAIELLPETFRLRIVGSGSERERLQALVQSSTAAGRISMEPARRDVPVFLREIDALVLPSKAEGFGLVLIEAMAAGVPVVAANVPGARDVVTHGVNGLLTEESASPQSIATALIRLREDDSLRASLIQNGRATVEWRYDWSNIVREYIRVFALSA